MSKWNTRVLKWSAMFIVGLPWWLRWWRICLQCRRPGFDPWVREISWRKWLPTPVFLLGKFHRQRSQVSYSPWGHRESDKTERLTHTNINMFIFTWSHNISHYTNLFAQESAFFLNFQSIHFNDLFDCVWVCLWK